MPFAINVNLPDNAYEIAIAPHALTELGGKMQALSVGKKVLLVSNPEVFALYGETALSSLTAAGFQVSQCILSAGEEYKTLASIETIYDAALANRLERSSTMVALGGGVIGDMTGFAAATWLRGINFVQVPTTLLAMVDASIGGKTGVNHPQGKNLIGAFYQPLLVLIDPLVLPTLPPREFRAGMAEVIKYGVIWDKDLFAQMEAVERLDEMSYLDAAFLQEIIVRSCQSKADVVSKDEKESGLRAILNYGHTIAHAVESLTGYTTVIHGEAVAIGMVAASKIALMMQMWDGPSDQRQLKLIQKAGLPVKLPSGLDIEAILDSLQTDKKVKAGKVRFILPTQIGEVTITDKVTPDIIRVVLAQM